jgi:hypothetical protein
MLFFQPRIELKKNGNIFKQTESIKNKIEKSTEYFLDVATGKRPSGLQTDKIDFVLMPEYSVAGYDGIQKIIKTIKESKIKGQVLIAGIDGLNKEEFLKLLNDCNFTDETKKAIKKRLDCLVESTWINTAIIIEKGIDGNIRYFLQPKLHPSPLGENETGMLEGRWVLFFYTDKDDSISFFINICFDFIFSKERKNFTEDILNKIKEKIDCKEIVKNNQNIFFVPQHNPNPNNDEFMNKCKDFIESDLNIGKYSGKSLLIMINSASKDVKDNDFGYSSIIYRRNAYDTYKENVARETCIIKTRTKLDSVAKEIRFRENKECIHAVEVVLPLSRGTGSGAERSPIEKAYFHNILGEESEGNRYPKLPFPTCAYKKILCDIVDKNIDNNYYYEFLYSGHNGEKVFKEQLKEFEKAEKQEIVENFKQICKWKGFDSNCDSWNNKEENTLLFFVAIKMAAILAELAKMNDDNCRFKLQIEKFPKKYKVIFYEHGEEINNEIINIHKEIFTEENLIILNHCTDDRGEVFFRKRMGNILNMGNENLNNFTAGYSTKILYIDKETIVADKNESEYKTGIKNLFFGGQ